VNPPDYTTPPDAAYTSALRDAIGHQGRVLVNVVCHRRDPIAEIRDSLHGAIFSADVPVEEEVGLARYLSEVKAATGWRAPTPLTHVAFLVEHPEKHWHRGPIVAWCPHRRERIVFDHAALLEAVALARQTGKPSRLLARPPHCV